MLQNIRDRVSSEKGFTLIELLVVVLIIGILAAIAIPAFLGQRSKAQDASAKSMTRNAASAAEAFLADNNDTYVGLTAAKLGEIEPSLKDAGSVGSITTVVAGTTADEYTVNTVSKSTKNFTLTRNKNTGETFRCTTGAKCTGNSGW